MFRIIGLRGREVLTAGGLPALWVRAELDDGHSGEAVIAAGKETPPGAAKVLLDGDNRRFGGRGLRRALRGIEEMIAPALRGAEVESLREIDRLLQRLDATPDKSRLGANVTLAVSVACARALASAAGLPLFRYLGGAAACRLPAPAVRLLPGVSLLPCGVEDLEESVRCCCEIGAELSGTAVSASPEPAMEQVLEAARKTGWEGKVRLGIRHFLPTDLRLEPDPAEMIRTWEELARNWPLFLIQDPLPAEDRDAWAELCLRLEGKVLLSSGSLFGCGDRELRQALQEGAGSALPVQPLRVGTLSESVDRMEAARRFGWRLLPAEEELESCDPWLADLAAAMNTGMICLGPPTRAEHAAKLNRLTELEAGGCLS